MGGRRDGDGPATTKALTGGAVHVVSIDHEIGGYEHDWRLPTVQQRLVELSLTPHLLSYTHYEICYPPPRC